MSKMSVRLLGYSSVTLLDITYLTGVIFFLCVLQNVHASWWYLGIASSSQSTTGDMNFIPGQTKCSLPYLEPRQREICSIDEQLVDVLTLGACLGIEECQFQFKDRRWNCTTFNTTDVFGKLLNINSRETAYIYAIFSAGVTHSVTRACSKGELSKCGCDTKMKRNKKWESEFQWGGCSENVQYGSKFSKEFVDTEDMKFSANGLMNLWNNEAGRRAVKNDMIMVCKCHGVSASCSFKVCWRKMNDFRVTGSRLKKKFDGASRVALNKRKNRLRPFKNIKKPTKKDLVYLDNSPDFCEYNHKSGSLGTHGRVCKRDSYGLDSCTLMCCGRGYYTIIEEIKEDCDCKFIWCCRVRCKVCVRTVEVHYCN